MLATVAVASVLFSARRRKMGGAAWGQQLMSVLLVAVSLFPCVSASDDVFSFAFFSANLQTRRGFGQSSPEDASTNSVIYLALQNLEHLQISAFYTLFVAIRFFGLPAYFAPKGVVRQLPSFASRAPPTALSS